ncbi:hypothetical protein FGSG_11256 [Fusarium graminearum PH-1]|uniref:hypothetical protein n=1 Tax=Gibberella zeae (strain ATCC MYA-4620 / CBS 123657 / FGSC 9075 / NRRL 31084 / PH-1) TaxID=229533 RepID=UPI00021F2608|nr:hypothetical protein FGSG_11256 [Fusarium graminearum PH-1]ESU18372.1 hypothetical protein FGSG_11256 [Fusarium graminearum PH-1]|eukprot:XP_011325994.1 hypothetical protein FGSG_11256 [Fusarium graminearum PH-1]
MSGVNQRLMIKHKVRRCKFVHMSETTKGGEFENTLQSAWYIGLLDCCHGTALRYAFAGINIVNDITLLVAPMPFLRSLQIARRIKVVLMGVFAAGAVSVSISQRPCSLHIYDNNPENYLKSEPSHGIDLEITVQQSFEMRTTTAADDDTSEKNLVTVNTAQYRTKRMSHRALG